jgi:hypothetical protein
MRVITMVVGVVLAKKKFFGYLSTVEADEYCDGSLSGGGRESRRPSGVLGLTGLPIACWPPR